MKTKIISLAVGLLVGAPLFAFADQRQDTIDQLLRQITAMQQQLAGLQSQQQSGGGSNATQPTTTATPATDQVGDAAPATSISFDRDLYFGLRGDADVSNLQEFLIDQGFLKGSSSGNYFILTQSAVKRFQQAHNIKAIGIKIVNTTSKQWASR